MEKFVIPKQSNADGEQFLSKMMERTMGTPIVFKTAPSASELQPNTWGYHGTKMYARFGDGTALEFSGASIGSGEGEVVVYIEADGSQSFTGDQSMGNNKLKDVKTPTLDGDAANKSYVDDNASNGVAFSAFKSSNQSVSNQQTITFTTEEVDTESAYNTTTSKFTAPTDGTYFFSVNLTVAVSGISGPPSQAYVYIKKNDTIVGRSKMELDQLTAGDLFHYSFQKILTLSANDEIIVEFDTSSASVSIQGHATDNFSRFEGFKVV